MCCVLAFITDAALFTENNNNNKKKKMKNLDHPKLEKK